MNINQLDIWFKPWKYTHKTWIENTLFDNFALSAQDLNRGYIVWCKNIGISYEFRTYHEKWLNKYWLNDEQLHLAINLLGSMICKQKDELISFENLRWVQQTCLARPIILLDKITFNSNFEAGINLLHQIIKCYCSPMWTRFLLRLPKILIENAVIYNKPILSAKMILIVEKLWSLIIKKIS